jgi:uncharacterized protein (DUF2252 family)
MRDALAELIRYNRKLVGNGRDSRWMKTKIARLCASPFGFLRGTFHLFAADWKVLGDDPLLPGPAQPIVGDLHLENFGAFKTADGSFVFDVNDFDESAPGSPGFDLGRVATSFLLADEAHGELRAVSRIEAFLDEYLEAARALDLRPIDGKKSTATVQLLIEEAHNGSRQEWIDARVEGAHGGRHFKASEKYFPVTDSNLRAQITEGVRGFAEAYPTRPSDCPSWPKVQDAAVRIAGTGSLGRFRYAVLMPGKNERQGKELVLELKEALPSSLEPEGSAEAQADRVIASQRALQGASPAYLGTARIDGRAFTVRELAPMEAKLDSTKVKPGELDELCAACGTVLGRAHRRAGPSLPQRLEGRDRALARRVAAFALRYADQVVEDWTALKNRRDEVEGTILASQT